MTGRPRRSLRRSVWIIASIIVLLAAVLPFNAQAAGTEDQEIRIGRQGAAQIESHFKVVKDPAINERVTRIGMTIAAVTERPRLPWTFKVVELNDANAVALPGGFVYLTTGLLRFVRSDHELAAVIAHESTHAAHGHGLEMMRRSNVATFVTILVAVFTRDPALINGSMVVAGGVLSGYSRDLEKEADLTGLDYLTRTSYAPVGMLTLLEHLQRREQLTGQSEFTAYGDHPSTAERVQYVEAAMRARRIPINRRVSANYLALSVRDGTDGGVPFAEILVNNRLIVRLADPPRIKEAAEVLDRLFDADLEPYEVMTRETQGGWGIFAQAWAVLRLTPRDVPSGDGTLSDFTVSIAARLRAAIEDDIRRRRMDG
jgi:Zn-dependent protease with chaperone function